MDCVSEANAGGAVGNWRHCEREGIFFPLWDLTRVPYEDAAVLHGGLGRSYPGNPYALKEAIEPSGDENTFEDLAVEEKSIDSLIYKCAAEMLVVAVGVEGLIVVNAHDAVLVVHKDQISLVKKVVEGFEELDLELYSQAQAAEVLQMSCGSFRREYSRTVRSASHRNTWGSVP